MEKSLIIIGAGPAGISAALYAKRANIDTTIIYQDESALLKAHQIDNYYGTPQISGTDLYNTGLKQAQGLGIKIVKEEVVGVSYEDSYVVITNENEYRASALILATGNKRNTPNISGIKELEGKGISYCAVCDGFFFRNKKIAVLGSGTYAYHEAQYLRNISEDIIILSNNQEINEAKLNDFNLETKKIKEISGSERVEKVIFEDDSELVIDALFIAQGTASSNDIARKLGAIIENNFIVVDENQMTNIPLLYACGDCTPGLKQVCKAVYDGALAANDLIKRLRF